MPHRQIIRVITYLAVYINGSVVSNKTEFNCTYASRVRLYVNTPLLGVEVECSEGTLLAEYLELVNVLITAVVPGIRETLGILVG